MQLAFERSGLTQIVSIRARPHGRAMPDLARDAQHCILVSIRARPHGRAMRSNTWRMMPPQVFQSAPGLTVGRCRRRTRSRTGLGRFNPRPASRSGDAQLDGINPQREFVSIRARPHGRAMPAASTAMRSSSSSFNPRPASRSGDAQVMRRRVRVHLRFNPRPASRSGDASVTARQGVARNVSIRARPHGRAMLPRCRTICRTGASFNPRPASRSGDAPNVRGQSAQ